MKKALAKNQQPKKQQQQLRKTQKKNNTFEFGVFDLTVPPSITEVKDLKSLNNDWVPFGDDNLFPQYLAELKRKSSTHRSVLAQKTVFTSGAKFVCENESLREFIEDVNADKESLRDVFKKLPIYPRVAHNKFVVHFKDYEPTFNFYGLPDYVAALEHICVDYEIGKWNHTKFLNGFQPSAIVEISGDMGEEEAQKMVHEAQKKFVGEGNNGKILFIVKNGDTSPANVQIIKDDQEGSWIDLQQITDQNIITANRWQPSLSGIVSSGKMNNTGSEIRIAYDLVMTTVIRDTSELLLNGIRTVLYNELGYDPKDLKIHYEPPISYSNDVDIKQVLTINEQRRLIDEDLPMLEDGDMFVADREVIVVEKDDDGDGEVERKEITVEQ